MENISTNVKLYEYDVFMLDKVNLISKHVPIKSLELLLESEIKDMMYMAYPEYQYVSCSYSVSYHSYRDLILGAFY